jgi:hypothetical protein
MLAPQPADVAPDIDADPVRTLSLTRRAAAA